VIELVPESYVAHLDLLKIFGRSAPLQVDLGCGDGSFLCELAARCPNKNFLGIERLAGRVAKAGRKGAGLDNVRVLHAETSYAVQCLLPEHSVETFYLSFPDPWPKRRHHRRRIFTAEFLNSVHAALEGDGFLRIATDHRDYFQLIERLSRDHPLFAIANGSVCPGTCSTADFPSTKFERKFREQGMPIYRLALRKVSPVT
jgi:tRNA (guanine-N7-)-methyltransferase